MSNRLIESAVSVVQHNPSVAAGTATFVIAFALVAGNAFYAQSGTHPEPIWATRDATFTHSVESTLKPVKTTTVKPRTTQIPVPARPQDVPVVAKKSPLVAGLQKALTATGDFSGTIDGLMGPMTQRAILAYQERNGFEETGKPSKLLLTAIEQTLPVASRGSDKLSGLISGQQSASKSEKFDREIVRLIQSGLAKSGQEVSVDGIYGSNTKAAIEAFQRRHRLTVTGKPDDAVLQKLKRLGVV